VGGILVPFEGEGSGEEALTWGQQHIWQEMDASGSSLNMAATRELAPGTTIDELTEELRFYMTRYESMRTRLVFTDGQPPRQRVFGSGEVPVEIVDADGADPSAVAEALHVRYRDTKFDYHDEWPVRMGVVVARGVPTHMVMVLCHIVSDAAGALVMFLDHQGRDPATGRAAREVGIQPRELAQRQRSGEDRRHSDTALRYWEEVVRAIPARRFPEPAHRPPVRHWQLWFISPAMALALRAATHRLAADTSSILLGAFCTALVRVTGRDPAVMRLVVSNRFRPGLAEFVGPVSQFGLCAVDVGHRDFPDVIRLARRRAMNANKHAYYDMVGLAELLDRVGRERGEDVDLSVYFNDRRPPDPPPDPPTDPPHGPPQSEPPDAAADPAIRSALGETILRWEQQSRTSGPHLMLHVDQSEPTTVLFAEVDAHHLARDDAERILLAMETLVVEAATS
jgi:hypothetical protein